MPYVQAGESRLYYEVHGEGPPILFAHGVGGNHASWFRQAPTFCRQYQVITFDHRGFGNSTDVERRGRDGLLEDIERVLDALELERAVLVGQSMGGGSTAAFTCRHPERVRALVHCDSLTGVRLGEPLAAALRAHSAAVRDLSQIQRVLGPRIVAEDPESALLYLQLATFNAVNARTITGTSTPWSPAELAVTGVPVLFVVGEDDVVFPPEMIRAVHEQTPGSRFVVVPGAGHSAYFEQPAVFNRIVLDFLVGLSA